MGSWLRHIVSINPPLLIRVCVGAETVAMTLCHTKTVKRRFFFKRTLLFFNEFPFDNNNMVIEYNGLLVKKGYESLAWQSILQWLDKNALWDELHINLIADSVTKQVFTATKKSKLQAFLKAQHQASFAVFNKEADIWRDVELKLLSKNKRAQIRRASKLYAKQYGAIPLCIEAKTVEQALEFFDELEILHTHYWLSKGQAGSNSSWVSFNRDIIKEGFSSGYAQLLCFVAGQEVVGYLYNLKWDNTVYNIQAGFNYHQDNRFKPGYLCHYLAMEYCHAQGVKKYNLLAGDTQYKKSLTDNAENLNCLVIRRAEDVQFFVEDGLVKLVRLFFKIIGKRAKASF